MKKYWELFYSFLKIGTFTIGGGYAMVPLIEKEVVENKKWVEKREFIDILALAQSSPGPIAINTAVFVGYKTGGLIGILFTTLGSVLPSILSILIIATFFTNIKDNIIVEKIFKGIRPAVVSLICVSVIGFGKNADINRRNIIIPVVVVILVAFLKVTAVFIIIGAAFGGILYSYYERKRVQ